MYNSVAKELQSFDDIETTEFFRDFWKKFLK
jgi:hypothetical protein